ncbi:MAG: C4-dicarboxylate ABC transporter substrate-binding protein, partial [Pyramidobacter sp.]|nr:C4-dicarboxylate ABC transporter substrate-binding protein [Pyramidobacter sp.]
MKKLAVFALAGFMVAAAAFSAAAYPTMNIRLSHNQPVGSPEDIGAQTFKSVVEEKSGGKITVE